MIGNPALLVGVAIILFFSFGRFDRVTDEGGRELERIVRLLSPNRLRSRRIVVRAYLLYALAMVAIYLGLCAYAEFLPILDGPGFSSGDDIGAQGLPEATAASASEARPKGVTGFDPSNPTAERVVSTEGAAGTAANADRIKPEIALGIALVIVGLAPSFPLLQRVENGIRLTAHRFAGIPTRVISIARALERAPSVLPPTEERLPKNTLLLPRGTWARLAHYRIVFADQVIAPEEFREDLEFILAMTSWLLDGKLKLENEAMRSSFNELERDLARRVKSLIADLDSKSSFYRPADGASAEPPEAPDQRASDPDALDPVQDSWERLAEQASELAHDFRILVALYREHEIIRTGEAQETNVNEEGAHSPRQHTLAMERLRAHASIYCEGGSADSAVTGARGVIFGWAIAIAVLLSLLWSLTFGALELQLQWGGVYRPYYQRLGNYLTGAMMQYVVPLVVILAIYDSALRSDNWRNVEGRHWTAILGQFLLVILGAWLVATLFVVGLQAWQSAARHGWGQLTLQIMGINLESNGPAVFRGIALGWILITITDRIHARGEVELARLERPKVRFWTAMGAAVVMALFGAVTRWFMSVASAKNAVTPRDGLDATDYGLIFYAGVLAGLIGFAAIFFVTTWAALSDDVKTRPGQTDRSARLRLSGPET
ncbi:MAG: hypothetical protein CMI67_04995 [Pelagibaca sp.]|nr:hypothetical protein [Pelagibaca sp.]